MLITKLLFICIIVVLFIIIICSFNLLLYRYDIFNYFEDGNIVYDSNFSLPGYYQLLHNNTNYKYTPGGIPKIIIKTSWQKINELPREVQGALKKTISLNPDYTLYYFDNDDVESFMKDFSLEAYNAYKSLIPGAYRADLFRYCFIYKYGGCYSDIGHVMKQSFDYIVSDANIVIIKDTDIFFRFYGIHNALICSTAGHQFFKQVIDSCVKNINKRYYGNTAVDITGPTFFYKEYRCYFEQICRKDTQINSHDVTIGNNQHNCEKCKIKMLLLNRNYILDHLRNKLIRVKFNNYYSVMYPRSKNKIHYSELWYRKKVYKQ